MVTKDHLEQLCLDWFREGGNEYANGYDIGHDGEVPEIFCVKVKTLKVRF